jgi:capsular exopolysaccharide synthesis family protein
MDLQATSGKILTRHSRYESERAGSSHDVLSLPPDAEGQQGNQLSRGAAAVPWFSSILRMLGLVRRHFLLILVITALASGTAGLAVGAMESRYKTTALLMLDRTEAQLLGFEDDREPNVDSQVEILTADNIAETVAERLRLDLDPEFAPAPGRMGELLPQFRMFASSAWDQIVTIIRSLVNEEPVSRDAQNATPSGVAPRAETGQPSATTGNPPSATAVPGSGDVAAAVRALQQKVAVRRRGMTEVIAIEAVSSNPQRAAEIANAYAGIYMEEQAAAKLRSIERAELAVSRRVSELSKLLERPDLASGVQQLYQDSLVRREALSRYRSVATADARIVAPAVVPDVPSFPPRGLLVMFGTLAGLGVGVTAAYLREAISRRVETEEHLERISRVPNLGVVPYQARRRRSQLSDEVVERPLTSYAEAIRRLHFTLNMTRDTDARLTSLVVTSPNPGDGKTTLALSLARAAAETGLKVVVVDCDLVRPGLHARAGVPNEFGLADFLTQASGLPDRIGFQDDPLSNCKIISSGRVPEAPPQRVFRTDRLHDLLASLEKEFDLVVFDVPAVGLLAESLVLVRSVDAVLVVVRSGRTTPNEIKATVRQLHLVGSAAQFTALNFAP